MLLHLDKDGSCLSTGICSLSNETNGGIGKSREAFVHHKSVHRVPIAMRMVSTHGEQGEIVSGI
jgi:hypothetical protein